MMPDQVDADRDTRLYNEKNNNYGGMQGFIQVYNEVNNTWSFVNTSDWNFSDATVACREMGMSSAQLMPPCIYSSSLILSVGYKGVAEITSGTADVYVNVTHGRGRRGVGTIVATLLPTIISTGLQCIGSELSLGDCLKNVAINSVTTFLPNVLTTAKRTGKVSYKGMGKVSCTSTYVV